VGRVRHRAADELGLRSDFEGGHIHHERSERRAATSRVPRLAARDEARGQDPRGPAHEAGPPHDRGAADREDHAILHRHGRAIKTLQQQVKHLTEATPAVPDWQASKEETTGVHELRAIQKAHADLQARLATDDARKFDEATWWSRQRWVWTVAAITIVFAATMTGCVGYVAYRIQALEKHTEKH
jgi:hypothetical protein